jgi:hypothetical protein
MAKKKTSRRPSSSPRTKKAGRAAPTESINRGAGHPAVTAERFMRLFRLVRTLGQGPKSREQLTQALGLDVRGFYRDLELLRTVGITVQLEESKYVLVEAVETVVSKLPYPDPHLTLGEMKQIAKGRSRLHKALQEQIAQLLK